MVKKINFLKNNANMTVFELVIAHYSNFRKWYLAEEKVRFEEYNEEFGSESLKKFFRENSNLDLATLDDSKLLDNLLTEFVIESWDKGDDFFEFFIPIMSRCHYEKNFAMIQSTQDPDFITLWQYITLGRDFASLSYRQTVFDDLSVGFLERDEYLLLQQKIEHYFGNILTLRKRNYVGLECMLQAILDLTENNRQIISIIEL